MPIQPSAPTALGKRATPASGNLLEVSGKGHSKGKRSRPPKRPFLVTGSALASGYVGASNVAALGTDHEAFSAERLNCAICGDRLLMIGFLAGPAAAAQQN
jgi:hypothetical protein